MRKVPDLVTVERLPPPYLYVFLSVSPGFAYDGLSLHYKLDNQLDLVFLAAHQRVLKLPYVDGLLEAAAEGFRETYADRLRNGSVGSV